LSHVQGVYFLGALNLYDSGRNNSVGIEIASARANINYTGSISKTSHISPTLLEFPFQYKGKDIKLSLYTP
jgi:hypothetical protein